MDDVYSVLYMRTSLLSKNNWEKMSKKGDQADVFY